VSHKLVKSIKELKGLSYPQIAEWFNFTPLITNPTPETYIQKKVRLGEVVALVDKSKHFEIMNLPVYASAVTAYNTGNALDSLLYLEAIKSAGLITEQEWDSILTLLQQTEVDPTYQSQILGSPRYIEYGFESFITPSLVQEWLN
jgi:hypothetical protein